jgi:hypothetical protein
MITKKQLETFNQHFKIIETTNDVSTHQASLDLNDLENYKDRPCDFLLETDWVHQSSDIFDSDGYSIQDKKGEQLKEIYDLDDIVDFIENDMQNYLTGDNE